MTNETSISVRVSAETYGAIQTIAARHGISTEQFAREVVRRAAEGEAELLADIEEGRRQIAAGDYVTHEELADEIQRWKRGQRHAA